MKYLIVLFLIAFSVVKVAGQYSSKYLIGATAAASAGINANPTFSYRLSPKFYLGGGTYFKIIRWLGPSTYNQYGINFIANFLPAGPRNRWNFLVSPELQFIHFVNFPGEPNSTWVFQTKTFEFLLLECQTKISVKVFSKTSFYFGLGPAFFSAWSPSIPNYYYNHTGPGFIASTGFYFGVK